MGMWFYPHSCWIPLNNSATIKAVTVSFCSIQWLFMKGICAKFNIPNLPQSPDIGQISRQGISDFRISNQSFINKNGHNSRTSHDINMKLVPVNKLDKRSMTTSKVWWGCDDNNNDDELFLWYGWPTKGV